MSRDRDLANHWFAVLISGMVFTVAGVLFLVSRRQQSEGNGPGYYQKRQRRLEKGFDQFAVVLRQVLVDHYGQESADAIVAEARQEFVSFIPRLPHVGGDQNRATNDLVGASYGLALYKALKARGKSMAEIARLTHEVTVRHLAALPWTARLGFRLLRSLIGTRPAQALLKAALKRRALRSQQRRYPDAPVFIYVEGDGEIFDCGIDYVQCPIYNFFRAEGAAEFAPYICLYDYEHSRLTGVGLTRTMTLAEGAPRCDFRFKVGAETVNLQTTRIESA